MARKVFISFLGYSNYGACKYYTDDFKSQEVRYVQEATLDYLTKKESWDSNSIAYILLTKGAENVNWIDNGQKDRQGEIILQTGLETQLKGMNLPFPVEPIKNLPDGNNEEEIWSIFETVFDKIQVGDELYFDLTHGFRYLPMLALVLSNYSKFLKGTTVKHISYGNFEGRDKGTNEALLVNLLPLTMLQDWTYGAANYLENGNAKQLLTLSEVNYRAVLKRSAGKDENAKALRSFANNLKDTIEDFQTCRGLNIIRATNITGLKNSIAKAKDTSIKPLEPVIEKIDEAIESFDGNENIKNGFCAVKWCLNNGLFQQAATILQESIVSFFAMRHDIEIDDEEQRSLVNKSFNFVANKKPEEVWNVSEEFKDKVREIIADELILIPAVHDGFAALTEVRNDINHSGMRSKRPPMHAKKIRENIEKCATIFEDKLFNAN